MMIKFNDQIGVGKFLEIYKPFEAVTQNHVVVLTCKNIEIRIPFICNEKAEEALRKIKNEDECYLDFMDAQKETQLETLFLMDKKFEN